MRTLFLTALFGLAITSFGADNTLGTWKLDIAKSKYTPGPLPVKDLTVTREAADGGVKSTTTGERVDGSTVNSSYVAKYDGTEVQVTGSNLLYDRIAVKQVNANTLTDTRKNTGTPYKATGRMVISKGKDDDPDHKGHEYRGKAVYWYPRL